MNENQQQALLIIEDSDEDFVALTRMMNKANISYPVYRCEDGEDALDFLYCEGKYADNLSYLRPALIVLDLNLPGTDGREVLTALKNDQDLKKIPVVIFSTSSNPKDIEACYRQGVSGYIIKPMNIHRLNQLVNTFLAYWFQTVELPIN